MATKNPLPTDDPAWYCVQSQKKHEHIAAQHLALLNLNIEVYCPRIRYQRPSSQALSGKAWVSDALFPGYLFARFSYPTCHRAVRHAPGVSTIVHFGDLVPSIPEQMVLELRSLTPTGIQDVSPIINIGSEVKLVGQSFHGMEAVVTQVLPAKERIRVLLEFLGRLTEVEVPFSSVVLPAKHPLHRFE